MGNEGCSGGDPLVLRSGVVFGDLDAVLELHVVEHVGDELVAVEASPALLRALEQLVGHRERGGLRAGALRDAGAQADGREARLDRIRGPQMAPVLGGIVIERRQRLPVAIELRERLRVLRAVLLAKHLERSRGVLAGRGLDDL